MLYNLTRPLAKIALATYFQRIHLSHRERIPAGKPVILAANHPTAFIEPCILACWLERPLNFVARGDLYLKFGFIRWLYRNYRLTPVFRLDDAGYGHLKTNFESFQSVHEALSQNRAVMILAEGRTRHEKRLRPLMKGTARMVFGALEKYPGLDIYIVPVGVNYTNSDAFRSDVMIDFGDPIRVLDYEPVLQENPAKAVNSMTAELKRRLEELVIHIENPADDDWTEVVLEMARHQRKTGIFSGFSSSEVPLLEEKSIADRFNQLSETEKSELKNKVLSYTAALKKAGVTDAGLMSQQFYTTIAALLLGLGWLPYLFGRVLNAPPLFAGKKLTGNLAKTVEFRASVQIFSTMIFYLLYMLLWFLAGIILREAWVWAVIFLIPVSGYYALIYRDLNQKWKASKQAALLDDALIENLVAQREKIWTAFKTA